MRFDKYKPKRKKKFCSLEMKLNIISDYKNGMKIKELNKKYKINVCNINYWVKNEENFRTKKQLFKKTIHSGAFRKINIDEKELLEKLEDLDKKREKINTQLILKIVKENYTICGGLKDYHLKSWIYRFVKKYHLKSKYFMKKIEEIESSIEKGEYFFDEDSDLERIEFDRINNKPFYIEKVLVVGDKRK